MILATRFTVLVIVEKSEKKACNFTQKWLDHLLLMTSYIVTIETDITELDFECAREINSY